MKTKVGVAAAIAGLVLLLCLSWWHWASPTRIALLNFQDFQTAKEVMARLSAKGIGFALDDFGSGYAGLSRYMALSFDCVKIDRSLLEAAMSSGRNDVLLRSLASCFTSLGMLVVLEGVEDEDCFSYASSFPEGVLIQGYRCASPMDQDSFISFLEENAR